MRYLPGSTARLSTLAAGRHWLRRALILPHAALAQSPSFCRRGILRAFAGAYLRRAHGRTAGAAARYFNWRTEFAGIGLINRQLMYGHPFFVAITVLLMGLLCLSWAAELVGTPLGWQMALGCAVFWLARLLIQFVGYSPALWRGKRFKTCVHLLFAGF